MTGATPCRWTLTSDGTHQQIIAMLGTGADEVALPLYLAEEDGWLVLWQHVGDPDSWKYLEFKKRL
jgi:hypothetical protein